LEGIPGDALFKGINLAYPNFLVSRVSLLHRSLMTRNLVYLIHLSE